jgi:hypothetical protein
MRSHPTLHAALPRLAFALVLAAPAASAHAAPGPDVTVYRLTDIQNYGAVAGVRAYAIGTTSCNVGSAPVNWCDNPGGCGGGMLDDRQHPVIAQNLYRLKDGRFEQIGMSWLKHGFVSTNSFANDCRGSLNETCQSPPLGGDQLGIGCTDTYGAGLNGSRPLGMRSEVDPTTGFFPFPETFVPTTNVIDQRLQVDEDDLNPALNPGATYWAEGQYISDNDALEGNPFNNASYAPVTVGAPPTYNLSLGTTVRERFAIQRWAVSDPTVALVEVDYPSVPVQRFLVARKVTRTAPGTWHWEIAVQNVNSALAMGALTIDFPGAAAITQAGFKDIDHHSGEPYSTTDWTVEVDAPTSRVTWRTQDFDDDPNANALRWGTMYNFWFDVATPAAPAARLETFEPDPELGGVGAVRFTLPAGAVFSGPSAGAVRAAANAGRSASSE